jgi:cobalt-zinc-cadmium efflux system protein
MHEKRRFHRRSLLAAFVITACLLLAEFVVALLTNSLALLADAGHMLADTTALGMALWATSVASRGADDTKSYGYGRAEVLVAFLNAIFLFVVAVYTITRAVGRIREPEDVAGGGMLAVAVAGLAANVVSGLILLRGARENINIRAALFHVTGDALGSVGVLAAASVILLSGWMLVDPIVSLVICTLIIAGGVRLFLESWHILMEGVPRGFEQEEVRRLLCRVEGVVSVHDIHAWSITSGKYSATAHIVIRDEGSPNEVRLEAAKLFKERWGITHLTLQIVKQSERGQHACDECCLIDEPGGKP